MDDLVDGIVKLLFSNYNYPVNLGNPDEITINEFAQEILVLTEQKKIVYKPLPENDPLKRRPDISLASKKLDWKPSVDRKVGLRKTYDYFCTLNREELFVSEHQNFKKFNKF